MANTGAGMPGGEETGTRERCIPVARLGTLDALATDVALLCRQVSLMRDDEDVELRSYDPSWPDRFEREGIRLLDVLGDSVRDIAHVGSTAVSGMLARPIVDIVVGVDSLETVHQHVVEMQSLGYDYHGEARFEGRLDFTKRQEEAFDVAIVLHGGRHWQGALAVRDYLRSHPDEAERYGEQKRHIVDDGATTRSAYAETKADVVEELVERARDWAREE